MELAEKRCIIFGADSGIGSALHSHFKRNGYVCLGSTRRIETSQDCSVADWNIWPFWG
jgi:short-subunit dehydrogenase